MIGPLFVLYGAVQQRSDFSVHTCRVIGTHTGRQAPLPYGTTASYGELARSMGVTAREVGTLNAHNPISVVVPCHRVIGADGKLIGYAGGIERKQRLLILEGALPD